MKVCEKESRIGAGIGLFTEMRVWPLPCRNNRNIIYKLKKTYKKQIDIVKGMVALQPAV